MATACRCRETGQNEANILAISGHVQRRQAEMGGSAMSKVMLNIDMAAAKGGKEIAKVRQRYPA